MRKTRIIGLVLVMSVMLLVMISCQAELDICQVAFNSMGGSSVPFVETAKGMRIAEPNDPVKAGYLFNGWYQDSECTNAWDFNGNTVASSMTLYAKWTETYTISFESQEDSIVSPVQVGQGMKLRVRLSGEIVVDGKGMV